MLYYDGFDRHVAGQNYHPRETHVHEILRSLSFQVACLSHGANMHVNDIEEISETVCGVEHTCECVEIAVQACRTRTDKRSDPPPCSKVRPSRTASVSPQSRHLPPFRWSRDSPVCDCTCANSCHTGSILPSVDEHGSSDHQRSLWFSILIVGGCRHRSAVGGDDAPVGSCHPHGLAPPLFVVLGEKLHLKRNLTCASASVATKGR